MSNDKVKIAAVQMNPTILAKRENLDKILGQIDLAASNNADLVVFPECALTGYVFTSREEAIPYMEAVPGPSTSEIAESCLKLGVHVIVGLLEIDKDNCFNTAVLIGPEGVVGKYRKVHAPYLGVDRFIEHGDQPFQVYNTPVGNIGMHICYDCNFPECARVMTLQGADILVLITNWLTGCEFAPKHTIVSRVFENKVHMVAVDRVGVERGIKFIGQSKIINALGDTVAEASTDIEEIVYADLSLTDARQKDIVFKPGEYELNPITDRRPEFYQEIIATKFNR